jgi:hypothetical protein
MRYPYTIVHLYILIPSYSPRIHGNTLDTAPGIEWIQEGNEGLSVRGRWQLPIARHHANRRPPEMCPGKGLEMQWLNWGIYVALKFKWSKEVGKQNFRVTDDWNSNNNTTQYMRNNTQVTLGSGDWGKLRSFWRVIGSCRVCVRSCRVVAIPQLKSPSSHVRLFWGWIGLPKQVTAEVTAESSPQKSSLWVLCGWMIKARNQCSCTESWAGTLEINGSGSNLPGYKCQEKCCPHTALGTTLCKTTYIEHPWTQGYKWPVL